MNYRMNRFIFLRVLVCLCVLALAQYQPPLVRALDLTVDTADDEDDGGGCVVGDCSLREAIAAAGSGDTIYFAGDYVITLTAGQLLIAENLTIDGTGHNVTIDGNAISRVFEVGSGYTVSLNHLTIVNGYLSGDNWGGGILNSGTLTLNDCLVQNNQARFGGGLINLEGGTMTILNSTISGNQAEYGGGGVLNRAALTIESSILSNNTAYSDTVAAILGTGGGLQSNNTGATATVVNSTFTGNQANGSDDDGGGAIMIYGGAITLTNCTVSGNSTTAGSATNSGGGGIRNTSGTVNLQNTLVANNTAANDRPDISGAITSLDYNLIEDTTGATIGGTTDHNLTGVDPLLSALGDYGGNTETMPLLPGSPAIDAADGTACAADPVDGVDQRNVARPVGAGCDIGAFESRGFEVTITGGDNQLILTETAFDPLSVQISSAFGEPIGSSAPLTFAGPESGAGTVPISQTVSADIDGNADALFDSNATAGSYSVTVTTTGVLTPAEFSLTNRTNEAPTAAGGTVSTDEDTDYVFAQANLNYADSDSDPLVRVRIVTLPADGVLYLDADGDSQVDTGEALSVDSLVTPANITAGRWKFEPAANENGSPYASFTLRVHDGWVESSSDTTITIDVIAVNDLPTISSLADQQIDQDSVLGPLNVTVGDIETPAASLTLSGASSNPALVPVSGITFGGAGANRTVTVTPAAGMSGIVTITLTVNDGSATASDSFVLTVVEVQTDYIIFLPLVVRETLQTSGLAVESAGVPVATGSH